LLGEVSPVAILNTQFIQVALPIMVTLVLAAWLTNNSSGKRIDDLGKRIDDLGKRIGDLRGEFKSDVRDLKGEMNRRFEEMHRRFDRIETMVSDHGERIVKLEERTSPLTRR
jgi:methyl-accepting chemotaxis protein